jgi:hypothetical protein
MGLALRESLFHCSRFTCRKGLFTLVLEKSVKAVARYQGVFQWFQWKQRGV